MKSRVLTTGSSMALSSPSVVVTRLPDAPANITYPYDVAADGKILALTLPGDALAVNVLMNWQTALGRAAADVP
jgi:hypothetical protein